LGLLDMHGRLWIAFWLCLAVFYVVAFLALSKGSDIDTETGLQRVTNVILGFLVVQIAVAFFIAFQAASKR
jgi:heme A synthase